MPTKVFVGNLPDECAQETIRDVFGSYGGIDDIAIIKNFAFVHFENEADANKAVKDLDGTKIAGKQVNVEISKRQDNSKGGPRRDNRDFNRDRGDRGDRGDHGGHGGRGDRGDRGDRGGFRHGGHGGPDRMNNAGGILGAGPLAGPLGLGPLGGGPLSGLGGLGNPLRNLAGLGASTAAPLGGLGILSAVNTLAAVAEKQQLLKSGQLQHHHQQQQQQQQQQSTPERRGERDQPDPDVRVRREVVHTRDVPNASAMGLTSGYVIYERYYVDPTHPLLKGLPLPDLPRMSDGVASRDNLRSETRRDNHDGYRDRSPVNGLRNNDFHNDFRR